jgi:SAM-dependent methyltransferase
MGLSQYVETLTVLGDENRLRLCALLSGRELCVSDLVQVTGISQPRVSTHLGRLRDAGFVRDRRRGPQSFYALAADSLPATARVVIDEASRSTDSTLRGDQRRLADLEAERRGGPAGGLVDALEQDYSPGRTWRSLATGIAALLRLGDVLDVGSGDGSAASAFVAYCRALTCIDSNARAIEAAKARLAPYPHAVAQVADVHDLPFADASFDSILVFHTLTYAKRPAVALKECARVLRPGGRLVLLCLDRHTHEEVTERYGEHHAGFSARTVRALLGRAGLDVITSEVACREARPPQLQVVLAIADKPTQSSSQALLLRPHKAKVGRTHGS